jgi:5-methylcytosine-specific restriction endonuclease McrA
MKFELDQYNRNTPDDELIADVKRVALELGKDAVTIEEQNERGRFHATTLTRRFGSWMTVLEKAGLQQTRTPMNIPEEDLFRNLEEIWTHLGRQPRYQDLKGDVSRYCNTTYAKRFGSWRKALEAFVAFINREDEESSMTNANDPHVAKQAKQRGTRDINWRLRFIVMRRDNFKCRACGRSPATDPTVTLDVDHIKAWSKGGPTVLENLQTLCTKCNIGKSDLEFENASANEVQNVEV